MRDPDAAAPGGWWHWVRFDIPAGTHRLDPAAGAGSGRDGTSSFGTAGYGGPCPPPGDPPHHYRFVLQALDLAHIPASSTTTGPQLEALVRGHVLGSAVLVGRFGRAAATRR